MKRICFLMLLLCPILTKGQIITTIAGNGTPGFAGDGGGEATAELYSPKGIVFDSIGNMYVLDAANKRVRKIDPTGIITTVAGNGTSGYSGDGGPATNAELDGPQGIAIDGADNIYIAEQSRIRKISPGGIISTIAGSAMLGFSGDGGAATSAEINVPTDMAFDRIGNMYIVDRGNHRIRKVNVSGIISTFAGNGMYYLTGDGGPATAATLYFPCSIAVDTIGNVYVADRYNYRIRKINTAGIISTFAGGGTAGLGDGGPATAAFMHPNSLAVDKIGNIYLSDDNSSRIRKIDTSGIINTLAGTGTSGFSGDGGPATAAQISSTDTQVDLDLDGNIFISDCLNNRIRILTYPSLGIKYSTPPNESIKVYPNPSKSELNINSVHKITSVSVSNILGRIVYSNEYNAENIRLNITQLQPGVYFVNVNGGCVGKFEKQ